MLRSRSAKSAADSAELVLDSSSEMGIAGLFSYLRLMPGSRFAALREHPSEKPRR
jgi:hypothetical protein